MIKLHGYHIKYNGQVIDWRETKATALIRANSLARDFNLKKEDFEIKKAEG